jgi:hypothetical protein
MLEALRDHHLEDAASKQFELKRLRNQSNDRKSMQFGREEI